MDHGKKDADGICQDALLKAFARDVMIDMWYMTKDEGEHDKSWWIWYDLAVFDHMVVWAEKRPTMLLQDRSTYGTSDAWLLQHSLSLSCRMVNHVCWDMLGYRDINIRLLCLLTLAVFSWDSRKLRSQGELTRETWRSRLEKKPSSCGLQSKPWIGMTKTHACWW